MTSRGLFLDRDGTLIHDVGYPRDPALVTLLPGAAATLREARSKGWQLVIVSNQSGVARGIIAPEQARAVQARVEELFAAEAVTFDGVYFCFHGPEAGCDCRKPAPGMLLDAIRDLRLDPARSAMVGDKASDVEAGRLAGCDSLLFTDWAGVNAWLRTRG